MGINFLVFDSVNSFRKYIDQAIADTKTEMGKQMKNIDDSKKKLAHAKNKARTPADTKRLEIAGFKVLVSPTVEHELKLMEETFSSLQDRLTAFESTKALLPHMTDDKMKVGMVLDDGLPSAFMFDLN
jgi:vacuolar-type H+-ATPase subunit D/Vma8